ncbi:MAG: hypothetical protein BRC32_05510 [Actinobacteria bacterium QS_8_72_14]|nr:MAG: hypothetical protein BRC32_05510 [Actinobacteria bacterium QS_8_72_14]
MATLYSASAVLPGDGRCVADAGVLVEGERVAAVAPVDRLAGHASRRHHVDGALLPALVNAATVVELDDAAESAGDAQAADPFAVADPLDPAGVLARPGGDEARAAPWSADRRRRSAPLAVDHLRWGTGVPAMTRTRLPGDSLIDVGAVGADEADDVAAALRARLSRRVAGRRVGVALAAPPDDGDVAGVATAARAAGDAPLRVTTRPGRPVDIEALGHAGVLRPGVSVGPNPAVDVADAQRLARAGVSVLVVPRAASAPDLAPVAEGGAGVVLGGGLTPAPDPLADAAAFAGLAADAGLAGWPPCAAASLAEGALTLVTGVGAARLGWGETAGSLAPGRRADLVAVEDTGAATGRAEAVLAAAGRQVLTVLAGVQRARRASADVVWPPIDAQAWRDEGG